MKNLVPVFSRDLDMPVDDFIRFRDFICEKSGIYFAENKMYMLTERLYKRMAELGITSFRDYFYIIKYDVSLAELNILMNLITTQDTSFFRNEPQLQALTEEVLPLLLEKKQQEGCPKALRVWSAGCSTGEEPYSLAILLREYFGETTDWTIEILANDLSEEALRKARAAEYSGTSLRNIAPELLAKYFTETNGMYRVASEIRSMVRFAHFNLNDARRMPIQSRFDIIFCRNVMPYFSNEVKRTLVRNFYNSLRPGGYFFIGHAETIHGLSKAFKLVYFRNALVYHKDLAARSVFSDKTETNEAHESANIETTNKMGETTQGSVER